ncbi:MAG: hypothetical protein HYT10_01820 [Candidatus Levybacteria bacterium]|nr:hypothetical protein [Candidatus Levybacteria bacterium]
MDILLQDVLKDSTFTPREVEYIKNYISTPLHPLAWQKELVDLVKIAQHLHKSSLPALTTATLPKPVQKAIQEHLQKYAWLPYDKPDAIPYTFADILVHLQEALKNPVLKYKQSVLSSRIRYKLTKKQSTFIELLRKHTYYDNYAADLYGELDYLLQRYLCKTYGVLFKDVTWYSWKELEQLYKNGKQVSPKRLALRKHYRVMVCNRKILRVYDGKTAYHRYRPRVATVSSPVKQPFLYGLCAYPGRAKGHVTVVVSTNDIAKVQKGDILVAQMTRPDLIFAMRKAAAIITDTGGMTSHAAIVAREFQIPCIVGTTNATKRLKDGDLVEVRSHRGMVTILS